MSGPAEPRLFAWLLRLVVRGDGAEFVRGDIAEEFVHRVRTEGPASGRRWYRREALRVSAGWIFRAPRVPLETYQRELRLALRALGRAPTYSLGTLATLALGLGGSIAVFALASSVLSPLPFPDSDRLVAVWETREGRQRSVSPANYLDWRASAASFRGLAAHMTRNASITVDGLATRGSVGVVSGNYFDVLGVAPQVGRTFEPTLNTAFPDRLVVLGHTTWMTRFGGDRSVTGRTLRVDDETYEVIGVMPEGFGHPEVGVAMWVRSRTEAPEIAGFEGDLPGMRDAWYFQVVGRLAPSTTIESAAAELASIGDRLRAEYPIANREAGTMVVPLLDETVAGFGSILLALALVVGLLLVAASANVMHLALARSEARASDVQVKRAIGASGADVRRGLLLEGWLLGGLGAAAGLGVAYTALTSPVLSMGGWVPRSGDVRLGMGSVAFAVALGLLAGTTVALIAYLRGRASGTDSLRARGSTGTPGSRIMIASQVAVAVALIAATSLLGRSLRSLAEVDLGFEEEALVTLNLAMPDARARAYQERLLEYDRVLAEIAALPAVRTVAVGADTPLSQGPRAGVFVVGTEIDGDPPDSGWQPISPTYFEAVGMTHLQGRIFGSEDRPGSLEVAVVNEAFVASVLGGADPIGVEVTMGLDGHDKPLTIVGVVADTRTRGPAAPSGPVLYRPIAQTDGYGATALFVAARVTGDESGALGAIRETARSVAPGLPVYGEALGSDLARPFQTAQSALLAIVGIFATTALLLGAVGVYAVAAYGVRRRRREIGVRLALGADAGRVMREVLSNGLRDAAIGLPVGVLLAYGVGRALGSMLFGITAADPMTHASAVLLVVGVTTAALVVPGRSAAATDPSGAMRDG